MFLTSYAEIVPPELMAIQKVLVAGGIEALGGAHAEVGVIEVAGFGVLGVGDFVEGSVGVVGVGGGSVFWVDGAG